MSRQKTRVTSKANDRAKMKQNTNGKLLNLKHLQKH